MTKCGFITQAVYSFSNQRFQEIIKDRCKKPGGFYIHIWYMLYVWLFLSFQCIRCIFRWEFTFPHPQIYTFGFWCSAKKSAVFDLLLCTEQRAISSNLSKGPFDTGGHLDQPSVQSTTWATAASIWLFQVTKNDFKKGSILNWLLNWVKKFECWFF